MITVLKNTPKSYCCLNRFVFFVLFIKIVILSVLSSSCSTTRRNIDDALPDLKPTTQKPGSSEDIQGKLKITSSELVQILEIVRATELSYARGDCADVGKRSLVLRQLLSQPVERNSGSKVTSQKASSQTSSLQEVSSALPLSTLVALADCAARNAPSDAEQSERALTFLNEAAKTLTPTWDILQILSIKADKLEKKGKIEQARETRKTLAWHLQKTRVLEQKNEMARMALESSFQELSATEKEKIQRYLSASMHDNHLFETLAEIDANATPNSSQAFLAHSRKMRERIILRLEELYALETSALVTLLQSGQQAQAQALATKIKQRFPTLNFQRRTEATLLSFETASNNPLSLSPSSQLSGLTSVPLTSDMTLDQRIKLARESLDQGRPDQSVAVLRSIPENARNLQASQLLNEAENMHIRDLRLRVRDLFKRAEASKSPDEKRADFEQSLELLNFILREYPKNSARKQIEKNARNIESQLKELRSNEQ